MGLNMKKIESLAYLVEAVSTGKKLHYDIHGTTYRLDPVRAWNMHLAQLNDLVKEGVYEETENDSDMPVPYKHFW